MARPKRNDPESALLAAMALFWRHGYAAVGTRQIEDEAGITRFTLQRVYGGKKRLFLMALDKYLNLFEELGAPPNTAETLDDIADWFELRLNPPHFPDLAENGCLMLATLAEFASTDTEVNQRADHYYALVRGRFANALTDLKQSGRLPAKFDVSAGTELLLACAMAMNMQVRAAGANLAAEALARSSADMVRGWASV